MSTPSRSASCLASALGRTLKPITSAFDADARLTSFSVIPPTPVWITLTRTSGCWIFPSSPTSASTEPWTSPLRTMLSSCTAPACICSKSVSSETTADGRTLRELLAAEPLGALLGEILRLALVLDHAGELPGGRRMVEAEDLDRLARPGLLDASRRGSRRARAPSRPRRRRRSRRRREACRAARASSPPARARRPAATR